MDVNAGHKERSRPRARRVAEGITQRHSRRCALAEGAKCNCRPAYQAMAWSAKDNKPVRRTFPTLAQARTWRREARVDLARRQMNVPSATTVGQAAEVWLEGARAGIIRTRSGERFKPSAVRGYEGSLRREILPRFATARLSALTRNQVQDMVDELVASGLAASSVTNTLLPLRAIVRRALSREEIAIDPMANLSLPKDRSRRERVAAPQEIELLLAAIEPRYRVLFAAAIYTGLRRGELQALGWDAVDLDSGVLRVERAWDRVEGLISPKSRSGERTVPVPSVLGGELRRHRVRQGCGGEGFVFSVDGVRPFDPSNALRSVNLAWKRAGLRPIKFHECRHTYASLMIAAGVNPKALSQFMGHSSITVTLDRYGHLFPGSEKEAADLLDAFLVHDLDATGARG